MTRKHYISIAQGFALAMADTDDGTARNTILRVLGCVANELASDSATFKRSTFVEAVYDEEAVIRTRRRARVEAAVCRDA